MVTCYDDLHEGQSESDSSYRSLSIGLARSAGERRIEVDYIQFQLGIIWGSEYAPPPGGFTPMSALAETHGTE